MANPFLIDIKKLIEFIHKHTLCHGLEKNLIKTTIL